MRRGNLRFWVLVSAAVFAVGGCQFVGPNSIDVGRGRYNNIIQSTSMEQTMSNIVRVYKHEPPMFMDVTEVDATVSVGGSATGASSNIGAKHGSTGGTISGQVGSAGGTIQYTEAPTIRYQPLLGQALVAQLVTPVSVDALGLLYDSAWSPAPLIDFSSNYMTPDPFEFYSAIDTITELEDLQGVEIAAAQSGLPKSSNSEPEKPKGSEEKTDTAHATNNDSMVFYLLSSHKAVPVDENRRILQLWVRMLRIYNGTQPQFTPPDKCKKIGLSLDDSVLEDWDVHIAQHVSGTDAQKKHEIADARDCLPNYVELRIVPAPLHLTGETSEVMSTVGKTKKLRMMVEGRSISTQAPLMRTYSALGILKNATDRGTSSPRIGFVTPDVYQEIRGNNWNSDPGESFYTMLPGELDSVDCPAERKSQGGCENPTNQLPDTWQQSDILLTNWLRGYRPSGSDPNAYPDGITTYEKPGQDVLDPQYIYLNARLGTLRRYILIIVTDDAPSDAYVSFCDGGRWYSIAKDDTVSQRNFQLISLFMSMMAIPPSTQPLSPVINVGGGG